MQQILADLFERDLRSFEDNLSKVSEDQLWIAPEGVTNSAGILAQHIVGNLMYYVGAGLGGVEYQRDREREFSKTGKTRTELLSDLAKTRNTIPQIIRGLTQERLREDYPLKISSPRTTHEFLVQLYGHLSYHMGQLNYLRRITQGYSNH